MITYLFIIDSYALPKEFLEELIETVQKHYPFSARIFPFSFIVKTIDMPEEMAFRLRKAFYQNHSKYESLEIFITEIHKPSMVLLESERKKDFDWVMKDGVE
ncbi:MAG: hypothetical protein H8E82_08025 [Candidatus Marinimicrobia bacterium]|nr:hypothetical protein [Candidatus Neomarinimicrobiota bacterium]